MPGSIVRVVPPVQFEAPLAGASKEVDVLVRSVLARAMFNVNGAGLTVAVLDTGLNTTHVDFAGKVLAQVNFTPDNGDVDDDATDGNGHGTNCAGIIVANGDHIGIAPGAGIVPIKILPNVGGGDWQWTIDALQWVIDNHATYNISAVNLSIQDFTNNNDDLFANDTIATLIRNGIRTLSDLNIATVISAGNANFTFNPASAAQAQHGMSFPAILRECISVGAVYDANEGAFGYFDGAVAFSTAADRITPFSQRLHPGINPGVGTNIFAPGAPVTSSGISGNHGESTQQGTSQAAPVTTGMVLLIQEFHLRLTGSMPSVADIKLWLQQGGVKINDGDDEDDNVRHTGMDFLRLDAVATLEAVQRHVQLARAKSRAPIAANARGAMVPMF